MLINKELCPYCKQTRDDICERCNDRKQICVCCVKYLFIDEFRQQFLKIIQENSKEHGVIIDDNQLDECMLDIIDFGCILFDGEDEENNLFIQL